MKGLVTPSVHDTKCPQSRCVVCAKGHDGEKHDWNVVDDDETRQRQQVCITANALEACFCDTTGASLKVAEKSICVSKRSVEGVRKEGESYQPASATQLRRHEEGLVFP